MLGVSHDKGVLVDDGSVHPRHLGPVVELGAVVVQRELVGNGIAEVEGVLPLLVHELEDVHVLAPGDDEVLEGAGVVEAVDVLADVGVPDVDDVLRATARLGGVERVEAEDPPLGVGDVGGAAVVCDGHHAEVTVPLVLLGPVVGPVLPHDRVGQGGEVVRLSHDGEGTVQRDRVEGAVGRHEEILAVVARREADGLEPRVRIVVVGSIVEDEVSDDGASRITVNDEDCVDGGIGHGDVPVVDGVDAAWALAGDRRGEVGQNGEEEPPYHDSVDLERCVIVK
mmetsp:Transcript_57659/g.122332  ORF Transcript_57659/g.122332 Transcript_57659/m.122332 type:complete len:282 (-) Transcript_57659:199-1044(-)